MSQPIDASYVDIAIYNQRVPCDGAKSIRLPLLFDNLDELEADFTIPMQTGRIDNIQCLYVDTHDLVSALTILCPRTQQRIIIPPKKQGFVSILVAEPFTILFQSQAAAGSKASVNVLNVPMPTYLWDTV